MRKSCGFTIQMKPLGENFHILLFIYEDFTKQFGLFLWSLCYFEGWKPLKSEKRLRHVLKEYKTRLLSKQNVYKMKPNSLKI